MKFLIPLLVLVFCARASAEITVASASELNHRSFDLRGKSIIDQNVGDNTPGLAWNNTGDWLMNGDPDGSAAEVRRSRVDPRTGDVVGEFKVLGGGKGEDAVSMIADAGAYELRLVVGGMVVATARTICLGPADDSELTIHPIDTRAVDVRPIGNSAIDLFPLAYNNTIDWRPGGDESAESATIVVTSMDAHGVTNSASQWTEVGAMTNIVCGGSEGLLSWASDTRAFVRVDLMVGAVRNGSAYFDFSQAIDAGISIATVCVRENFKIHFNGSEYTVKAEIYDADANMLVEGIDYQLSLLTPSTERPTAVSVTGLGLWRGNVVIPLASDAEVVMSDACISRQMFDTRDFNPRQPKSNREVLPFVWDSAWWDGSAVESLTVTPLNGDTPDTSRRVTLAAAGSDGTADWQPSGLEKYRAEIRSTDGDVRSVDFDFSSSVLFWFDKPKTSSQPKTIQFSGRVLSGMEGTTVRLRYGPENDPDKHEVTLLNDIGPGLGTVEFASDPIPCNLPGDKMYYIVYSFVVIGSDGETGIYRYESDPAKKKMFGNGLMIFCR